MPFDANSAALAPALRFNCAGCPTAQRCLVRGCSAAELTPWSAALEAQVSLPHAGKVLLEAGASADALFSVRAGCLKSCTVDADGTERVRAFYLPGDVIGLDALGSATHPARVVAVVPSQVCRIPRRRALQLMSSAPALLQRLLERTSQDLSTALSMSGDYNADQRVAAFLLSMRARLHGGAELRLPMTRRDIGSFLRLATETVCRVLARFENRGWLASGDRTLELLDTGALAALASPVGLDLPRAA